MVNLRSYVSQGEKVQASVMKYLIPKFRDILREGGFYEISQFVVRPNKGNYLLVEHNIKVNFMRLTKVKACSPFETAQNGYNFAPFNNVIEWRVSQIYAFG